MGDFQPRILKMGALRRWGIFVLVGLAYAQALSSPSRAG